MRREIITVVQKYYAGASHAGFMITGDYKGLDQKKSGWFGYIFCIFWVKVNVLVWAMT